MSTAERELEAALADRPARPRAQDARVFYAEVGVERLTVELFGQLDTVPYHRIAPIARVNPPVAGEYVVGADGEGNLVRASFSEPWTEVPRTDAEERRLTDELFRLRERVTAIEAALGSRAAFEVARDEFRRLPLLLLVPPKKKDET